MKGSGRFLFKTIETAILLSVGFILVVPCAAHAHRVNVFAWVEGETVHTESRFSGGRAVNGGRIVVYDGLTGETLLEGETDENGLFTFAVPRRTDLRIDLTAGMGHKNEWIVRADEISGVDGRRPPASEPAASEITATGPPGAAEAPAVATPVSPAQIEAVVEKVLDRKLSPVVKQMAELKQRRTTTADVFAGIGYILGLVGLGVYFHYRRKIKEMESR